MKLGLGLYRHMLNRDHYRFARQCGATHLVVHYVDYFSRGGSENTRGNQPTGGIAGWGMAGDPNQIWTVEELAALRKQINAEGLELAAIENFDPAHWYDVLLDGPQKQQQLENLKSLIRNVGRAGIPVIGYNFSLAGVCGRRRGPFARGGAESLGMEGIDDTPVPKGMVWNMVYDPGASPEPQPAVSHEQLWSRLRDFLQAVIPVAEEAGVTLAAHPDDPPVPTLRRTPRLVFQPDMYQRLLDLCNSPSNALEFCLGSLQEMTEGDIYEATDKYSRQGKVAYTHFRNVRGKVPNYQETFVDEGDIDMIRILRILKRNRFDGVLIPDHTPQVVCDAPWYAGMAYAMGWMRAAISFVEGEQR